MNIRTEGVFRLQAAPDQSWRARWWVMIATIAVCFGVTVGAGESPAAAASPALSGVVTCTNGMRVQGVWVQSSAGGSKWAAWYPMPGRPTSAVFSTTLTFGPGSSNVELHVGCGRNADGSWWSTKLTPAIAVSGARTLNAVCDARSGGRSVSCSFPPSGPATSRNLGDSGYCTWGAYEQWRGATGYYPNIGGNAAAMDDNAAAKGFRVTDVPQARAMIVFNRGTFGHVGWVTGIRRDGAGQLVIDYIDMNGGSWVDQAKGTTTDFNRFVARSTKWEPSVQRFILAPV